MVTVISDNVPRILGQVLYSNLINGHVLGFFDDCGGQDRIWGDNEAMDWGYFPTVRFLY